MTTGLGLIFFYSGDRMEPYMHIRIGRDCPFGVDHKTGIWIY